MCIPPNLMQSDYFLINIPDVRGFKIHFNWLVYVSCSLLKCVIANYVGRTESHEQQFFIK